MNGAEAVVRTLVDSGVTTCFANPGTSEMHFVAALDAVPQMRGVLCLFEGVATGAADGYGRMTGAPCGRAAAPWSRPGQRARQPAQRAPRAVRRCWRSWGITPPITSGSTRRWSPTSTRWPDRCRAGSGAARAAPTRPADAADAVAAALRPPGQVATLILPADVTWTDRR